MDSHDLGAFGERKAAEYLFACGFQILAQNLYYREGEIDILAEKEGHLFAIEVKTRRSQRFGAVVESMTAQKIKRIQRAVRRWRQESKDSRDLSLCFIGIEVTASGQLNLDYLHLDDLDLLSGY